MTDRELMQMALNALENEYGVSGEYRDPNEVMNALEERLAQYELDEAIRKGTKAWEGVDSTKFVEELRGEPDLATVGEVGIWGEIKPCKDHPDAPHGFDRNASHSEDRYVCKCEYWEPPPKREWVGLTDEEIDYLEDAIDPSMYRVFARRIEAKLKDKNGY
jgi:hypothetical protein